MSNSRVFAFVSIAFIFCGCTKTVQHRTAGYYPGVAPTTQPVPKTAVYSIRFLDEKGRKTGGIPDSHRLLAAGEHAGFDINEEKGLVAVAGNANFAVTIPPGYGAVWSTTYHKPTQFAKEVAKSAKAAGKVTGYIAKGIVEGILTSGDDDHCFDASDDQRERDRIYKHREQQQRVHEWRIENRH
ncbi:MAG TPA: hypothetical protein VGP94_03375 [Tepidisphaeraceae bacterium]|nr:hypothetical protein [Tepidisphaeraceae bacterium]